MNGSPLRRISFALFAVLTFGLASAGGCSRQGEGERCGFDTGGDSDCEDDLVCVRARDLVSGGADRCCPPEGESIGDSRCARGTAVDGGTGSGGTGSGGTGSGGTAGQGGDLSAAGMGGAPPSGEGGEPSAAGNGGASAGGLGGMGGA